MARILLVTWDGGGNLPPALAIAASLRDGGHEVRFLGHRQQCEAISAAGFRCDGYRHARPWSASEATSPPAIFAMFTDSGPGRDLRETVTREPADVAVIDCMSLGALRAASQIGLKRIALVHTLHEFVTRKWSHGPIGVIAALKGLRPGPLWRGCDLTLVTALPELDPAARGDNAVGEGGVRWIGPVCEPGPPAALDGRRVLVSLSTLFYPGQATALQSIVDALTDIPAEVVVTTGRSIDPAALRPGPNTTVHAHLPHTQVMPTCSLVVSHGGHGTAMQALSHNLPLLIVPMHPMLDQPMIGKLLQERGAAQVLAKSATAEQIRAAVTQLLGPGQHRQAAAQLGAAIRATDAPRTAAKLIAQKAHA